MSSILLKDFATCHTYTCMCDVKLSHCDIINMCALCCMCMHNVIFMLQVNQEPVGLYNLYLDNIKAGRQFHVCILNYVLCFPSTNDKVTEIFSMAYIQNP